jgi:hypothetical protein
MTDWTSPPTRRELTLLLFCLTVFVVAYNVGTSFRLIGIDTSPLLPFSSRPAPIGSDGRRAEGYRDRLENEIFGEWDWDPGHIAGVKEAESARLLHGKSLGHPDAYIRGDGRSGEQAMWLQGVGEGRFVLAEGSESTSVNDGFMRWGEEVPRTELRQHIPGTSISFLLSPSGAVATNAAIRPQVLPFLTMSCWHLARFTSLLTTTQHPCHLSKVLGPRWRITTTHRVMSIGRSCPPKPCSVNAVLLGDGAQFISNFPIRSPLIPAACCRHDRIHGVTFLSFDGPSTTDSHTLLSLQRLYSTLNISSPQLLPPPHRLLFPSIPTFVDPRPRPDDETVPRQRSNIGISPQVLKAAYPSLVGAQFAEDFDDYVDIDVPFLLDRLVIADRSAARRAELHRGVPAWSQPFIALRAREDWFEPMRRTLAEYFDEDTSTSGTHTITYLSRQAGVEGERLLATDHATLLDALQKVARTSGVKVHVVDENASWSERMHAIVQSTVCSSKSHSRAVS